MIHSDWPDDLPVYTVALASDATRQGSKQCNIQKSLAGDRICDRCSQRSQVIKKRNQPAIFPKSITILLSGLLGLSGSEVRPPAQTPVTESLFYR